MPQATSTFLLRGGLNLVTPPIAMPPGMASAALNYEPDASGYRRIAGYERYDGHPSPSDGSDASDVAARRALISAVPGSGPVRGVWVYDGYLYAFRDTVGGDGAMFKSSAGGWIQQTFGTVVFFNTGTAEFLEGEVLTGGTSAAVGDIERVVLQSGTYSGGTAAGFLVLSGVSGTFTAETGTSDSGSATLVTADPVELPAGGHYDFLTHNFYGAAKRPRMYFANGVGTAMEWDGTVLAPIRTGNVAGTLDDIIYILSADGDDILSADGDSIIIDGDNDLPTHIAEFRNHLFLGYDAGAVINSGIGEPLLYQASDGAAELPFGQPITGFVAASTALMIFGQSRVYYLVGNDSSDWVMSPITEQSGAFEWTVQSAGDQPAYLDEGGIRKLGTTAAFGDWRMGSLTELVEPFFRAKRREGTAATASLAMRSKDQLYLFFDDGFGVVTYLGRKSPETMPFLLPVEVSCGCSGELDAAEGERHFIGGADGYVYEMNRGTSFDGAEVQAFIRLPWNAVGSPQQQHRFHSVELQVDAPSDAQIGIAFDVDYAIPGNPGGARQDIDLAQGSQSLIPFADYDTIDWSQPTMGTLRAYLAGIGRNCAVTVVSEHTTEEPHTLLSATLNHSPRRVLT